MLKVYGTKTDPTRPVRPSPPPTTTTTTASPVRNSRTWLNTSSTATTMGSLSASGVVGPRSGHDSVARSKSGIDPSLFLFCCRCFFCCLPFFSLLFSVLFFSFFLFLAMASSQVFCVVQCDACDPCHSLPLHLLLGSFVLLLWNALAR